MIEIKHVDGTHPDFKELTHLLDLYLESLNGKELQQGTYAKFNTIANLKNAYVLYVDNKPAACGAFKRYNDTSSELKRVYVKEEYRNRHYSTMLIHYIEQEAIKQGYTTMVLESAVVLKQAHQVYLHLGYHFIDNFEPFIGIETSYCMKKDLLE